MRKFRLVLFLSIVISLFFARQVVAAPVHTNPSNIKAAVKTQAVSVLSPAVLYIDNPQFSSITHGAATLIRDDDEPDDVEPDGDEPDDVEPDGDEPDDVEPDGDEPDDDEPDDDEPDDDEPDDDVYPISIVPPLPSPSSSPVPDANGDSPVQVGQQESTYGVNEESYFQFVLNQLFYTTQKLEPPSSVYDESKAELHDLMKRAEHGTLMWSDWFRWHYVAIAIIDSFKEEHGAVFFDITFTQRWKYCGWVDMTYTFVNTDKTMRLCASLISVGMDDITRPPQEGRDYIIPGQSDLSGIEQTLEALISGGNRQLVWKSVRQDYDDVDLFGYPDYCALGPDSGIDANCYSFCCMSPYYGSTFCTNCGLI